MTRYKTIFFLFLLFANFGCKSIEATFPDLESESFEPFSPQLSMMNVQLEVDMDPFFKTIEKETPQSFKGGERFCEGVSYNYNFSRSPIEFKTGVNEIGYTIRGGFGLRLDYCPLCVTLFGGTSCSIPRIYGSCGIDEPKRRFTMTYGTMLKVNKDFSLTSSTELKSFSVKDPCKITFINYDVTDKVKKEFQNELEIMAQKIDHKISDIDLKSKLDSIWSALSEPVSIDSYGFLHTNPKQMSVSDIFYKNNVALFNLNLFFSPFISTNREPANESNLEYMLDYRPLKGFNIVTDIKAGYDSLSAILTKTLFDYEIPIKGRILLLKEVKIIGTNHGRLIFKVNFGGARKGTLYLTGIPSLDEVHQVLSFDDLDFEIKTKSFLLKSSQWLLNRKILNQIKDKSTIDLSSKFSELKSTLKSRLTGKIHKGINTQIQFYDLRISKLLLTSNQIAIRTNLTGNLKIRID